MDRGLGDNWSALYLTTIRGLSAADAASGLAMFSAPWQFAGGRADRWSPASASGPSSPAAASSWPSAIVVLSPWAAISPFGFAIVALGAANTVPVLIGAASRVPGLAPGVGVAAVVTAMTLGFLTAPPLIGFITQALGLPVAFAFLGVAAAAIAIGGTLRQRRPIAATVPVAAAE